MTRNDRWLFLLLAFVLPAALRPAKSLYPRFWIATFGSLLNNSAYIGSVRMVRYLLWLYPDVDARETINQSTSLMAAAAKANLDVSRYLLSRGADVNACSQYGDTALMYGAQASSVELISLLLESGADVNARARHGQSAFIEAAKAGNTEIMQLLLDNGADMLATGPGQMDAVIWSAALGQVQSLKFLLKRGMNVEGKRGHSALRLAAHKHHSQIISLLRESGAVDSV